MVTPFLTPWTYEALVADSFGIQFGISKTPEEQNPILFASRDPLSAQARNMKMLEANELLSGVRQLIEEEKNKAKEASDQAEAVKRFRTFAKTASSSVSLVDHFHMLEGVTRWSTSDFQGIKRNLGNEFDWLRGEETRKFSRFLRETVALCPDWKVPLKLLTLFSQTSKEDVKDLNEFRQMIIDKYGIEALAALWTLEEMGLVKEKKAPSKWPALRQKMKLVNEQPTCKAETPYEGYVPLILYIFKKLAKRQMEWIDCKRVFDEVKIPAQAKAGGVAEPKRILVVFIGGCTYGELAALRLQKDDSMVPVDFLTTQMLSMKSIFNELAGLPQ